VVLSRRPLGRGNSFLVGSLATGLLISLCAGLAAFAATWLILRHAHRLGIVQSPNARSSHTVPTPSGGGVGTVLGGTIATGFAAMTTPVSAGIVLASSLIIAAIGFYDDRKPLPAAFRLGAHFLLFAFVLLAAVPLTSLAVELGAPLQLPVLLAVLVLAGVYWINLFNFMDGIDGLAASQAIFMLGAASALALGADPGLAHEPNLWWLLGLAAATFGFLPLNWPPARIFMGDAGSTYLGFVIAALALLTIAWGWLSLSQWAILGAAFVTDATVTLTRRLLLREKVFEAHRRHAYQALSRRWRSHRKVTLLFIAINVVWLLPLAWLAGSGGLGWPLATLAYAPLAALAFYAGAGAPEVKA
jgi:Fuc2NAc and GlcNAc transferase